MTRRRVLWHVRYFPDGKGGYREQRTYRGKDDDPDPEPERSPRSTIATEQGRLL